MAVNVTTRDIVNFPGGTAKTVTVDVIQAVPKGSSEGDELWLMSTTTTATASGGGSIANIFKNEMLRGFYRSSGIITGPFTIVAPTKIKVAIDEAIGSGVDITITPGTNLPGADLAQDLENLIQAQGVIGGGGSKVGNLSYLNAQVRFTNGKLQIESGTLSNTFTGTNRSSVVLAAPDSGTNAFITLGFNLGASSETLAGRQLAETSMASNYGSGNIISVASTVNMAAGDAIQVKSATQSQLVIISGAGTGDGLSAGEIRFVTSSGADSNLNFLPQSGDLVRKYHNLDAENPSSPVDTMDELYRFGIDSIVNQIDYSV